MKTERQLFKIVSMIVISLGLIVSNILPVSAAPKAPSGSITIWADGTEMVAMKKMAKAFDSKFGVKVIVTEVNFFEIRDKFIQAAPAGTGPDIIVGAHDVLGSLVSSGLLSRVTIPAKTKPNFVPNTLAAFTYNKKLYGVPYGVDVLAMYVNTKLVPVIPKTWNQMMATAKKLQDSGAAKYGVVLLDNNPFFAYPLFTSFGGYVFAKDKTGTYDPNDLGLDSPGSIAAAQAISKAARSGLLAKGIDYGTMQSLFTNGQIGMMFDGPWSLAGVQKSGVPFDIAVIPSAISVARPFIGVRGMMISSFSKNKLAAAVFLNNFMATTEGMSLMIKDKATASAWKPINKATKDPILAKFAASAVNGDATPAIPEMGSVWDSWGKAMVALLSGLGDPAEIMEKAASDIRAAINKK